MNFTTTTEIARKGSKIFEIYDEAIVLNNNKNIGLILWWELANALIDSGILFELKRQLARKNTIEYEAFSEKENNMLMEKGWETYNSICSLLKNI